MKVTAGGHCFFGLRRAVLRYIVETDVNGSDNLERKHVLKQEFDRGLSISTGGIGGPGGTGNRPTGEFVRFRQDYATLDSDSFFLDQVGGRRHSEGLGNLSRLRLHPGSDRRFYNRARG